MRVVASIVLSVFILQGMTLFWAEDAKDNWPSYGIMDLDDHKAYFREGTYSYAHPDYSAKGQYIFEKSNYTNDGEKTFRSAVSKMIDVSKTFFRTATISS